MTEILSSYVPGTKAWFPDKDLGWISATLTKQISISQETGEVILDFILDDGGASKIVKTNLKKLEGKGSEEELPPLRNPPLLEATDDLTNLSYLNEPAGEYKGMHGTNRVGQLGAIHWKLFI